MHDVLKVEKVACTYCEEVFLNEELECGEWLVSDEKCYIYQCPCCGETDGLLFIKDTDSVIVC